jgi:hypothetical protein
LEAETDLRRHTRLNLNFALTTFAGGIIAVIALISSSSVTAATALVAGGIIAPVLHPPSRIALALITRHRRGLPRALLATVASLALIVLAVWSCHEMPLRTAWTAAWIRLSRWSLARMLVMWLWTVLVLSESSWAISWLLWPGGFR